MGGKGGSAQIEVNHYLMSMHVGLCRGPVDAITAAYYGEKRYWSGYNSVNQTYSISNTGLFGGDKKEGGVQGRMTFLMGKINQVLPDNLAQKLGRANGLDCPGFRGITSVFHTGPASAGYPGWMWCANSPYLKGLWYTVMAIPKALGESNSKLNPTDVVYAGLRPVGYRLAWSTDAYAPLKKGVYTLSEILRIADNLVIGTPDSSAAPHQIADVSTYGGCYVPPSAVGDEDGLLNAAYVGPTPDGSASPYAVLATAPPQSLLCGYITEVYEIGPGVGTSGGWAFRPNTPTIYPSPVPATYDANPAHIIYEVMTNTDYGMGQDPISINTQSFLDAAQTLFDEGLGLSMAWSTSTAAGDFIEEVKEHINALIFPDPETGKTTIKLIRDDYNVNTLRSVTPDNGVMTSFSRKAWGDTINEIVVTWTNPANEQEETVTLQDNGNIAEQGEVVSDSKNYYGARSAALAWKLAARDLRVASAPLCSAEVELDRSFWNVKPGDCLKVTWPEYGMTGLVMRVWEVKYGSGRRGSSKITVSLTEDVFSLPVSAFVQPPTTSWEDPSNDPQPFTTARVITMPTYIAAKVGGVSATSFEYPVAYAGVLGAAPNADTSTFELLSQSVDATGSTLWASRGTKITTGHGNLIASIAAEASSLVSGFNVVSGNGPLQSGFVLIGSGSDAQSEIALIMSQSGLGWTLKRGALDTVPREWPAGTPVWFMTPDFLFADETQQSAGSAPNYKLLANTSRGQLAQDMAPVVTTVLTDRIHRPLRPANLKVGSVGFGEVDLPVSGNIAVSWERRNRLTEETVVLGWEDGDVTPEAGQTTTLRVVEAVTGTHAHSFTGETGTSKTVNLLSLYPSGGYPEKLIVYADSSRDGLTSLQSHGVTVKMPPGGYGQNYGAKYG